MVAGLSRCERSPTTFHPGYRNTGYMRRKP